MDKIYIANHVKQEILNIGGLASSKPYNLNGFTSLSTLGYKEFPHCGILEDKLRSIAAQYDTGKIVLPDSISASFTVNQCIELIMV